MTKNRKDDMNNPDKKFLLQQEVGVVAGLLKDAWTTLEEINARSEWAMERELNRLLKKKPGRDKAAFSQ